MQLTSNLNLKKPESTDNVNIDDLNGNADILDAEVTKLASPTEAGRMSVADKVKLNGIAAGAQVNAVTSVAGKTGAVALAKADVGLGNVDNVQQAPITHVGAGGAAHSTATTSTAGFISGPDQTKLNGIAAGAQVNRTLATQVQAEAGTDNATDMTPLRTAQAIAAIAPIDHVDVWLGATSGTGTAYTTTTNNKLTAYAAGQRMTFQAHAASGVNPTLKPGSLAALPIRKPNGNAAKLDSGGLYTVVVNVGETAFILQGEGGEYGTAGAAQTLEGYTVGTESGIVEGSILDWSGNSDIAGDLVELSPTGVQLGVSPKFPMYIDPDSIIVVVDNNFRPQNIREGVDIFGIPGASPGLPLESGPTPDNLSEQRGITLYRKTTMNLVAAVANEPFIDAIQLTSDEATTRGGKMYYNSAEGYVYCSASLIEMVVSGIAIVHRGTSTPTFSIDLYVNGVFETALFPAATISGAAVIPFSGRVTRSLPANTQFSVKINFPFGTGATLRERALITFMGKGNWS